MNREEGDLRPQLLDRFGLMVEVVGPRDPEQRAEVVRRRLAFEADPIAFAAHWEGEQERAALRVWPRHGNGCRVCVLDEGLLALISRLCCEFEVDGLRADIVMHKTARALAALDGRTEVTTDDVRRAAELVLPHRQRRRPFEQPHLDQQRLDESLSRLQTSPTERGGEHQRRRPVVFDPAAPQPVRRIEVAPPAWPPVDAARPT